MGGVRLLLLMPMLVAGALVVLMEGVVGVDGARQAHEAEEGGGVHLGVVLPGVAHLGVALAEAGVVLPTRAVGVAAGGVRLIVQEADGICSRITVIFASYQILETLSYEVNL